MNQKQAKKLRRSVRQAQLGNINHYEYRCLSDNMRKPQTMEHATAILVRGPRALYKALKKGTQK